VSSTFEIATFKQAMGRFGSGVTVITMMSEGVIHGMTASAFSSLSLDPALVLVCVGNKQSSHRMMKESSHYVVNILARAQENISNHFARPRPEGVEEFAGIPHKIGPNGIPWIEGCIANIDCKVTDVLPGGDHDIFIGQVEHIQLADAKVPPLMYYMGAYRDLSM
jgi:flavin reductase (DIM6/NTAB) family NADH-FMN oxidoreductase RutF